MMRIESRINTTEREILDRKWNPYLGISINNKIFTRDYIADFMNWAAERAGVSAAVLVVDIIQRINNEVFARAKPMAAIEKAFKKADEILQLCMDAHAQLPPEKQKRIVIVEWPDVVQDENFCFNARILNNAFEANPRFKDALISITRRNLGEITNRLDEQQVELLAHYLLNELPEVLAGFHHKGIHYNLNVYPGNLYTTYTELLEQEWFSPIYKQLRLTGEIALAEAYSSRPCPRLPQ